MKILLLISALFAINAYAETEINELAAADEALQAPQLNIEGQYQVKEETKVEPKVEPKEEVKIVATKKIKPMSSSEKLRLYRERLEARNMIMVERKMEQIRFQQELALARKLEQSMNQTLKAIDTIK